MQNGEVPSSFGPFLSSPYYRPPSPTSSFYQVSNRGAAADPERARRASFVHQLLAQSPAAGAPAQAYPVGSCCAAPYSTLSSISPEVFHELISSVIYDGDLEFPDSAYTAQTYLNSPGPGGYGPPQPHTYEFLFDSGSDHHVLSLAAAQALFRDKKPSTLRVLGVSGQHTNAELQGHLILSIIDITSGDKYRVDLGEAHGMQACPVNLLSVSLLIQSGAAVHFETDNCWFQAFPGSPKIPFIQRGGMFQMLAEDGTDLKLSPADASKHSYVVNGQTFGASADMDVWHNRMRHLPVDKLLRIFRHDLVRGFKLTGRTKTSCRCDSCRQAKIRQVPSQAQREFKDPASYVGHTISVDLKDVPFPSFLGYRWVMCCVDHFSRCGFCYFLRSKTEVTSKLKQFVNDMARHGVKITNIQSDRGSEFFEQEGTSKYEQGRNMHEFGKYCKDQNINHILHPVAGHAKLAERWFLEHFTAAEVMLWSGRLSPAFWADAVSYSMHLYNLTPNDFLGGERAPLTLLTGEIPDWHRVRVFGCTVYEHIPNNPYAKVPGVPKGRKLIFVGFTENKIGYRVFDPETRRYFTTSNLYFYEDASERIDALRHHDRRRELLKKGMDQPVVLDDFEDADIQSVRNLYLDPDAPSVPLFSEAPLRGGAEPTSVPSRGAASRSAAERATDESAAAPRAQSREALAAERARKAAVREVMLRPVRLLAIGKEQKMTPEDKAFIDYIFHINAPLVYRSPCPKNTTKESGRRYLKYMRAKTPREALELGATREDFVWDYARGWISFPKHEPHVSGHIFSALEHAEENRHTHVLEDLGLLRRSTGESGSVLMASGFNARGGTTFQHMLETVYEPEVLVEQLATGEAAIRFAESQAAKVFSSEKYEIDFAIAPEPTKYEEILEDVCPEYPLWKEAMDDEIHSMMKFGVFTKVPRSAAGRKQVLGCKWVYRRKRNRLGEVTRYRARLVAQGFRQRPYDSFDPDQTYSPVVHKNSLRLFLSVCAALDLKLYQCDVKSAFLQADLPEPIYMAPPPGYNTRTASGEQEIWVLRKAIYGLKQSSACFWDALSAHLVTMGFKNVLGDPCLFKRVLPDGQVIMACTYVDDVTFACSSQDSADWFMRALRERFVIEEGEGKAIDFLLGMAIDQDLEKGTVSINMETLITRLAEGILTKEELERSKSVDTPMLVTPLQKLSERIVPKDKFDYLSVVGSLLHISNCVRMDIALAVGILARHAATPGPAHVTAAKRVLQYLYHTRSLGITYTRSTTDQNVPTIYEAASHPLDNGKNRLQVFCDSDYAADISRRSLMGMVVMLNGGPISWLSTLGKTVCTSTAEAEVSAAVAAAKEAVHLKRMLIDLDIMDESSPILIAEDNAACIAQCEAGLRHVRNAKHYEVRLRFLQQLVVDGEIQFQYCPTDHMVADYLTKPLDATKFLYFRERTMVHP